MKTFALPTSLFALLLAACSSSTEPSDSQSGAAMSKDDARAAGKADQGTDYCEEFGWYGDGECDDFCLQPDPDCGQGCDPTLMCGQAITCVDGKSYPTTCGPANCDPPMGDCEEEPDCDPTLMCGDAITCIDGKLYPTTCGPTNCDQPLGDC